MCEFFSRWWNASWLHAFSHASYFSGISLLIPSLNTAMETQTFPWESIPKLFWIALGLIVIGVFCMFWAEKKISRLLVKLGWMMVVPGMLALLFSFASSDGFFNFGRQSVTGFSVVEPVVQFLVDHQVPKTVNLGAIYVFFGLIFVWVGNKLVFISNYV